jgi:hypothetical protein
VAVKRITRSSVERDPVGTVGLRTLDLDAVVAVDDRSCEEQPGTGSNNPLTTSQG